MLARFFFGAARDARKRTLEYIIDDINEGFDCNGNGESLGADQVLFNDSILHVCEFHFNGEELDLLRSFEKPNDWEDW